MSGGACMRPQRTRKPPARYTPETTGPLPDDFAPEQHDDIDLDQAGSDVTSVCTSLEAADTDTDLSGFVVEDHDSEPDDASGPNNDDDDEEEWTTDGTTTDGTSIDGMSTDGTTDDDDDDDDEVDKTASASK